MEKGKHIFVTVKPRSMLAKLHLQYSYLNSNVMADATMIELLKWSKIYINLNCVKCIRHLWNANVIV